LYPWLALVSGLLLAAVGFTLFRRALRSRALEGHGHHHGGHHHDHEHMHTPPAARVQPLRSRSVLALGAAGGLVPSPSALVVLLGAIALGRTWFGILLVLGYGVGMALTLMAAGLLLVRARNVLERRLSAGSRLAAAARVLPLATASVVVVVGVGLAGRAATRI
ncbi:MAG: sulfite exporter TauE/SafE family protein, partial [Acidimicrobiia bacterium]